MSAVVEQRIENLLLESEKAGLLAAPSTQALRHAFDRRLGGTLCSPFRGLYARTCFWNALDPRVQTITLAATLHTINPDWVFGAFTAAAVYGLEVPFRHLNRICLITGRQGYSGSRRGIRCIRMDHPDPRIIRGIPVTRLHQTLLESMCRATFPECLALLDSALRIHGITLAYFNDFVAINGTRRHGIKAVRRAIHYADARSENGGESIARGIMIEEGFATPELQVTFRDPIERWRSYRVDFLWELPDGRRVAGELDGRAKTSDPALMRGRDLSQIELEERRRESRLTALGLQVARFSPRDVALRAPLCRLLEAYGIPRVRRHRA